MFNLVLASQSPRRRELLQNAGFEFSITSLEISEIPRENMNLSDQIMDLAWQKAQALIDSGKVSKGQKNLLLSADTVVVLDGQILGKPKSPEQARDFLRRLSGQTHSVITGVCLWNMDEDQVVTAYGETFVEFHPLSEEQIAAYVASGEPMDKAGAYGIQGGAGKFVKQITGAYDTVVGLPVAIVERILREQGWDVRRRSADCR